MDDAPGAALPLPLWRVCRILFDDEGLLVVDKPCRIPVYGGDESLSSALLPRLKDYFLENERQVQLSVHQRLDQDTSGVLCFVTDPKKNPAFARAFAQHHIKRRYLAVVGPPRGQFATERPLPDEGRVELWLTHDRGKTTVDTARPRSDKKDAKLAVTRYKVQRRVGERALVELDLETGRTHQIRATLAHLGSPVLGDRMYGGAPASRLMLHAHSISGGPLPRSFSAQVPPVFAQALDGEEEFPDDLKGPLDDAALLRAPLLERTSSYRLVNGAGDGLPGITIDVYGKFAVLNVYDDALLPRCTEIAEHLLTMGFSGVYLKHRVRADLREQDTQALAPEGPLLGQAAPPSYLVDEYGMQCTIELEDGLSTGLFVDMRENRFRARSLARGGRVLNLFCYTCTFSVSAALSGANTTNVDLSGRALARGRQNFEANGLDPEAHRFLREDAMKFLARAVRRGEKYDFIVLDPPSFATVGKGTFSVKNKYGQAVLDCLHLLPVGGRLLCVTNHRKTSPGAFRRTVEAAAAQAGVTLRVLKSLAPALDVPDAPDGPFPSQSLLVEVE